MPTLLLAVLFAMAFQTPDAVEAWPQPPDAFQLVNEGWETHAEGWDKAMLVPDPVYKELEVQSSSTFRGMGNGTSDVEQWRPLAAGQFPPEQLENALCVIRSESGGNSSAKNRNSNARGLFQIMTSVWADEFGFTYEDFYIPELNVYAAARIWERSGWQPWSPRTRRNCGL